MPLTPAARRPISPERAARIERIQDLLEDRRHPERRVGLFSATNITRLVLRFGAMALAVTLVHRVAGGTFLEVPLAAVAAGAADAGVGRLWRRIRDNVRRAWNVASLIGAVLVVLAVILGQATPESGTVQTAKGWWTGWLDRTNTKLAAKSRAQRTPVETTAAIDEHWRLLTDSGMVRRGTLAEARTWCAELGPQWMLPRGLGELPRLTRWPDLGTQFYVWASGGGGIQIGDGKPPAVGVSGGSGTSEVRAVLCLKEGP